MLGRRKCVIWCSVGFVLLCLPTLVFVRTTPVGRRQHKRTTGQQNLTSLAKLFNMTPSDLNSDNDRNLQASKATKLVVKRTNLDLSLPNAPATNTRKVRLYSKYKFLLHMSKGGDVDGVRHLDDPNTVFELQSVKTGILRMQHVESKRYLGMDKHGVLRGRINSSMETLFVETALSGYHTYSSYKYKKWYLAMRKSGTQKPGRYTTLNQKAVLFLQL